MKTILLALPLLLFLPAIAHAESSGSENCQWKSTTHQHDTENERSPKFDHYLEFESAHAKLYCDGQLVQINHDISKGRDIRVLRPGFHPLIESLHDMSVQVVPGEGLNNLTLAFEMIVNEDEENHHIEHRVEK